MEIIMTKEKVQINQVDAPTLFVGVGGTGCDIVKRVAEMCRPGETENINFVCLDTNVNDLTSIAKSKARIYYVQTSNTQTVGDYLSYDEDEAEAIATTVTNLKTASGEWATLFIRGEKDVDADWNEYIETIEYMGLKAALIIMNDAMERYADR